MEEEVKYFSVWKGKSDYKGDELKDLYTRHDNWSTLIFNDKE